MKHWGRRIIACLCGLFLVSGALAAQDKAAFIISGKTKGSVAAVQKNGTTYVDVQKTARKFGAGVELFAQSKQAKISTKGFYAILTAPLAEIIVNARQKNLSAPVFVDGGKIMTPVELFTLPEFQRAVDKYITFKDGAFYVERRFNLALEDNVLSGEDTLLVFDAKKPIDFSAKQTNKHTVVVTFPHVVLKRDENLRLKTSYIASAAIRQIRENAILKVILGDEAKDWSFTETEGKLVFRAGAQKAAPVLRPVVAEPAEKPMQAVSQPAPAQETPVIEKSSVLEETEELTISPEKKTTPVMRPAAPANAGTPAKPTPVLKQEPNPLVVTPARKKMRIMVDPGHGGKDPGAVRSRYREKTWNLDVAKELTRLLKKGGFEVKMTREDDTFIPLSGRSKAANNFKADLFVSIHTNASKNRSANGFQVYFRSEKATDKEAAEVAALENEAMQYEEVHYNFVDALLQSLAKNEYINESSKVAGYVRNAVYKQPGIGIAVSQNNSVRQANFYVLKGVNSPAILVEMGYISSSKDRGRLSNDKVRDKMAQGIYNGIYNYATKEGWIK